MALLCTFWGVLHLGFIHMRPAIFKHTALHSIHGKKNKGQFSTTLLLLLSPEPFLICTHFPETHPNHNQTATAIGASHRG